MLISIAHVTTTAKSCEMHEHASNTGAAECTRSTGLDLSILRNPRSACRRRDAVSSRSLPSRTTRRADSSVSLYISPTEASKGTPRARCALERKRPVRARMLIVIETGRRDPPTTHGGAKQTFQAHPLQSNFQRPHACAVQQRANLPHPAAQAAVFSPPGRNDRTAHPYLLRKAEERDHILLVCCGHFDNSTPSIALIRAAADAATARHTARSPWASVKSSPTPSAMH